MREINYWLYSIVKKKIDVDRIENNLNKIMEEAPIPNIRVKLGIYENVDTSLSDTNHV